MKNLNFNKETWKLIFQTAITVLTALGAIFGLQSCGIL